MHEAFRSIDPNGISINADGSITFLNAELLSATKALGSNQVSPMADNFGTCNNGGTCSGANLDCSNTGNCSGAQNFGTCTGGGQDPVGQ